KVIGGRKSVRSGADDDHVVAGLEVVVTEEAVLPEQADHAITAIWGRATDDDTGTMSRLTPAASSASHMYSPNSHPHSTHNRPASSSPIDGHRITEPAMHAPGGNRCSRTSSEEERMNTSRAAGPPSTTAAQPQVISTTPSPIRSPSEATRSNGHNT